MRTETRDRSVSPAAVRNSTPGGACATGERGDANLVIGGEPDHKPPPDPVQF
jgi:hypothetical protein